jgi:hypothetical protein
LLSDLGIRFFYKRAAQLLSTMFTMEDDYIMASFLHPNYKQLRGATNSQINDCHSTCRLFLVPASPYPEIVEADENYEPPSKKIKSFMSSLMDKKTNRMDSNIDEVDQYIELQVGDNEQYTNPLVFWEKQRRQGMFPNLTRLACRLFSIPCSSAAVERQFSAAGQIVTQRRSNLEPSTVNNILFLRSIEKNNNL